MKRFIFTLMALVAMVGTSFADSTNDKIIVEDVQIPEKGSAIAKVNLISEEHNYIGFQFDMQLPAGVSIADPDNEVTQADRLTQSYSSWTISAKQTNSEQNIYNVIVFNMGNAAINGTEGVVLNMIFTADETLSQGDKVEGKIYKRVLSTKEVKYEPAVTEENFTIEIVEDRVIFDETSETLPLYWQ